MAKSGKAAAAVLIGAGMLGLALLLAPSGSSGEDARPSASPKPEDKPMLATATPPFLKAAIPPIDAAVPAKTETATFALG